MPGGSSRTRSISGGNKLYSSKDATMDFDGPMDIDGNMDRRCSLFKLEESPRNSHGTKWHKSQDVVAKHILSMICFSKNQSCL